MAEVVADRLLGGDHAFAGADLSTKLKLLGVDVASFGDAHAATAGRARKSCFNDPVAGIYSKLVVSDDAGPLLGGVLVGDASAYRARCRCRCVGARRSAPASSSACSRGGAAADVGVDALAGRAGLLVQQRHQGRDLPRDRRRRRCEVAEVKACTKAGTGCGGCVPLLKTAARAELRRRGPTALCEHFAYSPPGAVRHRPRRPHRARSPQLLAQHGSGRGCEICKPAVASILASLGNGYILDGEQASLQDTNDHFLANLQRNGTYSVVPRIPGGEITPDKLIVIGEVARDFGLYTKITGGQRIDLFGARVEQLPAIWRRLVDAGFESGHAYGKALRTVKSCVGTTWCRYGVQDSVGLADRAGAALPGAARAAQAQVGRLRAAPASAPRRRARTSASSPPRTAGTSTSAATAASRPRHADLLAADLDTETLVRLIDRFLMFYIRTADRLERTAAWLEGLDGGIDHLREVVVDDWLGICAELEAAMERTSPTTPTNGGECSRTRRSSARFVSFVNAPGHSRPHDLVPR